MFGKTPQRRRLKIVRNAVENVCWKPKPTYILTILNGFIKGIVNSINTMDGVDKRRKICMNRFIK